MIKVTKVRYQPRAVAKHGQSVTSLVVILNNGEHIGVNMSGGECMSVSEFCAALRSITLTLEGRGHG